MARLLELHADGIATITRVSRDLGRDIDKRWRGELRAAAAPIAADARARYRGLAPLGAEAARTVRASVSQRGVEIRAGGKPWSKAQEFGTKRTATRKHNVNNAFGRGFSLPGVVKRINYVRIFGAWTGNQSTVSEGQVAGRALYPAAAAGRARAVKRLERLRDQAVNLLAQAGDA